MILRLGGSGGQCRRGDVLFARWNPVGLDPVANGDLGVDISVSEPFTILRIAI